MDPVDPLEPLSGGPPTSTSFRIARVLPPGRFAVPLAAQARAPAAPARRAGPSLSILFVLVVILAALGYGGYEVVRAQLDTDDRRATVEQFVRAWEKGDYEAMYALLDAPSQRANPKISFLADYRRANRSATVEKVTIGRDRRRCCSDGTRARPGDASTTDDFGKLEGTMTFKASETEDGVTRVAWSREQRLPGLRKGEEVRRKQRRGAHPRQHLRRRRQAAELRRPGRLDRRASRARSRPASSASTTTASAARAARRCASGTA